MKKFSVLNSLSGVLGFFVTFSFGVWLLRQPDSKSLSVTSWVMWMLLDSVLVALALKAKQPAALFIGWTISCALVVIGMLVNGAVWTFGSVEIISGTGALIALYFWVKSLSTLGFFSCASALFLAGVPQLFVFWDTPAQDTWWLWAGSALACFLSFMGSPTWKSASSMPTVASFCYQLIALAILFR